MTNANPNSAPPRPTRGPVIPHPPQWHQRLGAAVVHALVQSLAVTLRFRYEDRAGYYDQPGRGPVIFCVWHNRLAVVLSAYFSYVRKRNATRGMAAMCSASRDGAFLAAILERFPVKPARGSSSRRGGQALLELTSWADRGYDLAITPDGPRGPRYVVQDGVLSLAQLTGLPILPVCINIHRKIQVKSWDRFQIPIPFSSCQAILQPPLWVPRHAGEAERGRLREQLQTALLEITRD